MAKNLRGPMKFAARIPRPTVAPLTNFLANNNVVMPTEAARRVSKAMIRAKNRCEVWRVLVVLFTAVCGFFVLMIALSMPEWFILIRPGPLEGHVGFFGRCITGPEPNRTVCMTEIVHETAAVVSMFLVSMVSGAIAIVSGLRRIGSMQCKPSVEDAKSGTFQRLRSMMMISALSCMCGMGTFTYLYHDYLSPPAASYSLGWLATLILLLSGSIGFCFKNPYATKPGGKAKTAIVEPSPAPPEVPVQQWVNNSDCEACEVEMRSAESKRVVTPTITIEDTEIDRTEKSAA